MRLFDSFREMTLVEKRLYSSTIQNPSKTMIQVRSQGRVSQLDLYCLLKQRFGPPNGFQSFLRSNSSDNFINWHYSLYLKGVHVEVLGSVRFLEFQIYSLRKDDLVLFNERELIQSLNDLLAASRDKIAEQKAELEHWQLFLNTYRRLLLTTDYFFEFHREVRAKEPVLLTSPTVTKQQSKTYSHQMKKYMEAVNLKRNYGLALRLLYPVLAESLLNLILFALAKDEVRSDNRLLESTLRSQIDIRLKSMHLYCRGLKKPYDQGDERIKNFLRLMQKRNDFLHGNVLPANHTYDNVFFDGTIPLFGAEKDIAIDFLQQSLFQIQDEDIINDATAIKEFRECLLENIEESHRLEILAILDKIDLGWNSKRGRIGILFGDAMVQSFAIKG